MNVATLEYCFGQDWKDWFDLVITKSEKPKFFTKD